MSDVPPRWTVELEEVPYAVLQTIRESGHGDLYKEIVNFLRPLASEIGGDVEGAKKLPGLPIGDGRYSSYRGRHRPDLDPHRLRSR
ncbi:hypothetical protein [Streptomyces nanshensis]|uniref:Uncharacterized protein n=1 Tax=Streptomyces nanshensis TaxID=518642 RepID=A0A1E7L1C6_9ACTN|nr:hypothetical protein [Streptomyces nanshensis]OEV09931.1 hypothetical protein AN218_19855 [Streptomyces nanshensis]